MAKKRCRILVVEDDEQVRHLLAEGIVIEGYDVEMVRSGPDALTRDDLASFDVAVVDLSLPGGLDGWSIADYCAGRGIGGSAGRFSAFIPGWGHMSSPVLRGIEGSGPSGPVCVDGTCYL